MIKRLIDRPNFPLFELICLTSAAVFCTFLPKFSLLPLTIAIVPPILRMIAGRPAFIRTPFDLPIVIFILTAIIGVWAAYQLNGALIKFSYILIAVLFYYFISRQPVENLWKVAWLVSLIGFVISIYFLLSNNWMLVPQKFALISQIGISLMKIRPQLALGAIHPNDTAGMAGIALPFSIALVLEYREKKSSLGSIIFGLIALIIFAAIILSSSRGAWMAFGLTAVLGISWGLFRRTKIKTIELRKTLFMILLFSVLILVISFFWIDTRGSLIDLAIGLPDVSVADQRYHVFISDIELIKDLPFTGGGFESFPGLYSQYIMVNPNYILGYGHNIFLDATIQQGIFGGLMLLWIYLGSILLLFIRSKFSSHSLLGIAIISSLLIIIFHQLVDDFLNRSIFVLLIFFIPGMAAGLLRNLHPQNKLFKVNFSNKKCAILSISILLALFIAGAFFYKPLLSAWYTDLGSIEMEKVELADFPTGTWDYGQHNDLLANPETLFNIALTYEPENPQAHYRLGLIAMLKHDFPAAVNHLEIAQSGEPYHRGIIKSLGLSYIWNGQIEKARVVLSLIPETNKELEIYQWWWREQKRPDLASYAEMYLQMVGSEQ